MLRGHATTPVRRLQPRPGYRLRDGTTARRCGSRLLERQSARAEPLQPRLHDPAHRDADRCSTGARVCAFSAAERGTDGESGTHGRCGAPSRRSGAAASGFPARQAERLVPPGPRNTRASAVGDHPAGGSRVGPSACGVVGETARAGRRAGRHDLPRASGVLASGSPRHRQRWLRDRWRAAVPRQRPSGRWRRIRDDSHAAHSIGELESRVDRSDRTRGQGALPASPMNRNQESRAKLAFRAGRRV